MLTANRAMDHTGSRIVERSAKMRLAKTGYAGLKAIECSFRDGTMTLRGQVPSYYQKKLAQEAFRNFNHVNKVINHLEVMA